MGQNLLIVLGLVSAGMIAVTSGQASARGARDYGTALPRLGLDRKPIAIPSEPSGCAKCLSERYLAHYFKMGCTPKTGELVCSKPCWKYFECPELEETVEGCKYNGKVYRVGESVPVANPCRPNCYCDPKYDAKNISHPKIECAYFANDCVSNFGAPIPPNCYEVPEEGQCCSKQFCPEGDEAKVKCRLEGQEYGLHQTMYPQSDPCVTCKCDQQWNQSLPLSENKNCKQIECDIESDYRFKQGCIPIYHQGVCCPISYHCPPPKEHQCKFDGKRYNIGEKIDIGYNDRTECQCIVPPIFTCIVKTVQQSRVQPSPEKLDKAATVVRDLPKNNLSTTTTTTTTTTTPAPPCPPFVESGLSCAGVNCTTIIDAQGCQACQCQQHCPQLKCKSNCILTATTPGVCPECKCN